MCVHMQLSARCQQCMFTSSTGIEKEAYTSVIISQKHIRPYFVCRQCLSLSLELTSWLDTVANKPTPLPPRRCDYIHMRSHAQQSILQALEIQSQASMFMQLALYQQSLCSLLLKQTLGLKTQPHLTFISFVPLSITGKLTPRTLCFTWHYCSVLFVRCFLEFS